MSSVLDESNIMEERFVAFIDILGFTEIVKSIESNNTSDNPTFKRIKSILNYMNNEANNPYNDTDLPIYVKTENGLEERELGDPKIIYVSDCIIISAEPTLDGFKGLSRKIHKITADLAYDGIFCRGAITKGKLFHHDRIMFGSSYIRAYELEEKKAIFPRVIVDPDIIDFFKLKEGEFPLAPAFYGKDTDGIYYQRYWTWNLFPSYAYDFYNYLLVVRGWIIKHLNTFKDNSKILTKYFWLKDEFNNLTDIWSKFGLRVEKIESSEIHPPMMA